MTIEVINAARVRDRGTFVYIGRAWAGFPASPWGNPFSGDEAVEKYDDYIHSHPELIVALSEELERRGVTSIGCWCKPKPCHGDVLAQRVSDLRRDRIARK